MTTQPHDVYTIPLEAIAELALPALKPSFMPLDRSGDLFSWDPL